MLGHGAPWGHAEMCHRAGMPREDDWIDVWVSGQAGLLAGSTAERAEPLEGLAALGGAQAAQDTAQPSHPLPWLDCSGSLQHGMVPEQGIPSTSPYMTAMIWVTI